MLLALILFGCGGSKEENTLFQSIDPKNSGIDFSNVLDFDQAFNIYTYRNFYNGGGVAIGDVNNDGLQDIYFTANMKSNRLFLNKGNLKFEDVTEQAGVSGTKAWSTGVSMADINEDGWIDIYVCNSGDVQGDNKQNELFINNGDGTFSEKAEEFGIADQGFGTHGVFFDYDNDGDLDLYLLNNSYRAINSFNLQKNEREERDPAGGGDKLFQNQDGKFTDVSEEAGIYGSVIGFGLGIAVGDINKDGWQDIYVSNDFFERDYLYINNQDGTFSEELTNAMESISTASMGADLADVNDDGYPDIFVTEMLPEPNYRIKTKTTFEDWNKYQLNQKYDYYHQFTRNTLQLNNGDETFSEISRYSGIEATDWSWAALIADYDLDGFKDLFIANGIYQDLTDQDYLNFASSEQVKKAVISGDGVDYKQLISAIPSEPISNYAYKNIGNYQFENKAVEWGLSTPSHSNGSAYADLDNDGDLDLVVNNSNVAASLFKNTAREQGIGNSIILELEGLDATPNVFGTKVEAYVGDRVFYYEHMPIRGFQSTVDSRMIIGLGDAETVDQLIIMWPNGAKSTHADLESNQRYSFQMEASPAIEEIIQTPNTLFREASFREEILHVENEYSDFDREGLSYHMISREGPALAIADVNGDGYEDFYLGGAKDIPGSINIYKDGNYSSNTSYFESSSKSEDVSAAFFDADNDGDQDLYVVSGGSEFSQNSTDLLDRLYLNDGNGGFTKANQALPTNSAFFSGSVVKASDIDGDGDQDLFVGSRLTPRAYGVPAPSFLLENDGKGNFQPFAELDMGMITDARWGDIDGDNDPDLIAVGEWTPIQIFINENGILSDATQSFGLSNTNGWWNTLELADLDRDGNLDIIAGNHGLNSRFQATPEKPVEMYVNDFDQNGTVEQMITVYNGERSYPLALKHDLVKQMPGLRKKYLKYSTYQDQTISDIFPETILNKSITYSATEMSSVVALNTGSNFMVKPLPVEAQWSPMCAIYSKDFDNDGHLDILAGGNFSAVKPEIGKYDASRGWFLKGDGTGEFSVVSNSESGFVTSGDVCHIEPLNQLYLVVRNNDAVKAFQLNK